MPQRPTEHSATTATPSLPARLVRSARNSARRIVVDAAHTVLAAQQVLIQRVGFERVLALSNRSRNRLLRAVAFTGLSKAMGGIDRITEMRLAWKARWYNRDFALVTLVSVLNSQQKNSALLWWARRTVRTSVVRNALDEFAIETYTRMNDFDGAEAFVLDGNVDQVLRERALAEIALRLGRDRDFIDHLAAMATAGSEKRRPYLRWLQRFVERDQNPAALLPPGSIDAVLATSLAVQRADDHLTLQQMLRPALPSTKPNTWTEYREALAGAMSGHYWKEAAALALAPIDPPASIRGSAKHLSLTVARSDSRAAIGDRPGALEIILTELDSLVRIGKSNATLRLLVHAARRYPSSPPVLERGIAILGRSSLPNASKLAGAWSQHNEANRPHPKPRSRRCFIVANGPSIATMPLHLLEGEDIFVVNRGMQAAALGLPQPRFLVVSDISVYRDYWREIDAAPVEALFLAGACLLARPFTAGPNVHAYGHTSLQLSRGGLIPSAGLYHLGASVVLSACQIAHFMGYREINILGVDLSYDGPVSHFYGADPRGVKRLAAFRTGGSGEKWVNDSFAHLHTFFEAEGTTVHNVGRGGNLVTLPRLNLEDVTGGGSAGRVVRQLASIDG